MRALWLISLVGCGWNSLPDQHNTSLDAPLWDPTSVVATQDGLYVPLPHAGGVALVAPGAEPVLVDIGEGRIGELIPAPDGSRVVAIVKRYRCDVDDPREARQVRTVADCNSGDLVVQSELSVLEAGVATRLSEVDGQVNAVAYSDDGRFAIAYLDLSKPYDRLTGVVDLTSVLVLDLVAGSGHATQVGFNANHVLYVDDADGNAVQAVVLSQNSVALVDLSVSPPERDVNFHLTIDPDQTVTPVGIDLTPDGTYALISVRNRSELYALDLINPSVRIIELSSAPTDMVVDRTTDKTVLVSASGSQVDILEHAFLDVSSVQLDEPMTHIEAGDARAVLWSDARQDVYFLDIAEEEATEYRLQNPPVGVFLAPTEDFAVALTRPDGGSDVLDQLPGMEILDLVEARTQQFALEGQGLQVAFAADETSLHALILQDGVDYLYNYEIYRGERAQIELSAPPATIGTLPDGSFYITHQRGTGLVSFVDPSSGELVEVGGFATLGLIDPIELLGEEE